MAVATPPEVRQARSFLRSKGITTQEIPPRKFASAAKELDRGFREVLRFIITTQEERKNGTHRQENDV